MARRSALIMVVAYLVFPPAAMSQEPGVFFDPNNPTRSEYAVPLDAARGNATGGGDAGSRGGAGDASWSGPAPLFGQGISPQGKASGGRQAGAGGKDGRGSASGGGVAGGGSDAPAAPSGPSVGASRASSNLGMVGAGSILAVLVLGTAIGLLARRSRKAERSQS